MNNKDSLIEKIMLVVVVCLVLVGLIFSAISFKIDFSSKEYNEKDGFIISSTVYNDSIFHECSSISYKPISETNTLLDYPRLEYVDDYENKDIKNGLKPGFADIKYDFVSDLYEDEHDYIKFDLGGGFEYMHSSIDETDIVDKYSCYNKYTYNPKTKVITLYPDQGMSCEDLIDMKKTTSIKVKSFNDDGGVARIVIKFDNYTKEFKSYNSSFGLINYDVTGEYVSSSSCRKKDDRLPIDEKLVLNKDYTGTYTINDRKFDVHYLVLESYNYDDYYYDGNDNNKYNNVRIYVYSVDNGVFFYFNPVPMGLVERSELKGYTKIK